MVTRICHILENGPIVAANDIRELKRTRLGKTVNIAPNIDTFEHAKVPLVGAMSAVFTNDSNEKKCSGTV